MIKTIFFDFGNVLAHFDHWQAVNKLVAYTDMPGQELFDALYASPLEIAFEHGHLSTEEYVSEALRLGRLSCSPARFLECFLHIFTPNADVLAMIPELARSHRILLASNTNAAHFAHYCEQFADTLKHFAALPTSHQGGFRKPQAEFYQYCQDYAEAEPHECLFVDDLAKNIVAGQRHGWQVLHYTPGVRLADAISSLRNADRHQFSAG